MPKFFDKRSRRMLRNVHPDLVCVAFRALEYSAVDFVITEGLRSSARQLELYNQGRSKTLNSKHLIRKDGTSHAIDVMAVGDLDDPHDQRPKSKVLISRSCSPRWATLASNSCLPSSALAPVGSPM